MSVVAAGPSELMRAVHRPSVQVLGSPRVVVESVIEVLTGTGHVVSDAPDVVVLVMPDDAEWSAMGVAVPAVLLHDGSLSDAYVVTAITRGVAAVARLDDLETDALIDLVGRVAAGDIVLDAAQRVAVVNALRSHHHVTVTLTDRETDILNCVEEGCSVKQTARSLGISPKTVENTQRHLFKKLGVRNRSQAVARAHALGLLPRSS
ncbi:MAG: response regulator transcription factor [Acidimicrobiia bacterium]